MHKSGISESGNFCQEKACTNCSNWIRYAAMSSKTITITRADRSPQRVPNLSCWTIAIGSAGPSALESRRTVCSSCRHVGEVICDGDDIRIVVTDAPEGSKIKIGIDAPRHLAVDREEVREAKIRNPGKPASRGNQ